MMCPMTRHVTAAVVLVGVLALTGCSSGPTHDEFAAEFAFWWEDHTGEPAPAALSDTMAKAGVEEDLCGYEVFRSQLMENLDIVYAWDATCLDLLESNLSQEQIERTTLQIATGEVIP